LKGICKQKKNRFVKEGHTKKVCVHAAMKVPCCTLRARAEVPPLENRLNLW